MKAKKATSPEWSRKIIALRSSMGLTQAAFASRLHYSAMALSRWERGTHEPPAQCYIQLGNLAGEPLSGGSGPAPDSKTPIFPACSPKATANFAAQNFRN